MNYKMGSSVNVFFLLKIDLLFPLEFTVCSVGRKTSFSVILSKTASI